MQTNTDVHFFLGWSLDKGRWGIFTKSGYTQWIEDDEDAMDLLRKLEMQWVADEMGVANV